MQRRGITVGAGLQPQYSARTDVGRVREINEDRVFAGELPPPANQKHAAARHLLVVADGVGGLERGEWASEKALTVVTAELPIHLTGHEPRQALQLAFEAANQLIWRRERSEAESRFGAAATTVVAVIVDDEARLWWANVGDSRAYLFREDRVQRLTHDHSFVEELVRVGSLTPEQARLSERRNVITRSIGFQPDVDVDTGGPIELRPADVVLLCSDGLHGLLTDDDIAQVVRNYPAAEAAERLVGLGNERGGTDNISVIVCGFIDRTTGLGPDNIHTGVIRKSSVAF
jgi:serine/threonine protein phosphatase PrpC